MKLLVNRYEPSYFNGGPELLGGSNRPKKKEEYVLLLSVKPLRLNLKD